MNIGGGVIVVSSHVAAGAVGGRVSAFALEAAEFPVIQVATVSLAWHPGHGPSTRFSPERFEDLLADVAQAPWLDEVRGLLSGYLGDAAQAPDIAALVDALKAANPQALYLCDPVIGDARGLYVPETTAAAVGEHLVARADILTPNLAELGWLTGTRMADLTAVDAVATAAAGLGVPEVAVTSIPVDGEGRTGTGLFRSEGAVIARHPALANVPHGTGDLFAGLFLGDRLAGATGERSLADATAKTFAMAAAASRMGRDALPLWERVDLVQATEAADVSVEQVPPNRASAPPHPAGTRGTRPAGTRHRKTPSRSRSR